MDELDLTWKKSSFCGPNDACVEVAFTKFGGVCLRDSEHPDDVQWYSAAEWNAFVAGAKDGEFDV